MMNSLYREPGVFQTFKNAKAYEDLIDEFTYKNVSDPINAGLLIARHHGLTGHNTKGIFDTARRIKLASNIVNHLRMKYDANKNNEIQKKEEFYRKFFDSKVPESINFELLNFAIVAYVPQELFDPLSINEKGRVMHAFGFHVERNNVEEILETIYDETYSIRYEPRYDDIDILFLNINHEGIKKNFTAESSKEKYVAIREHLSIRDGEDYGIESVKRHEFKHLVDCIINNGNYVAREISADLFEGILTEDSLINENGQIGLDMENDLKFYKLSGGQVAGDSEEEIIKRHTTRMKCINEFPLDVAKELHGKGVSAKTLSYIVSTTRVEQLASTFVSLNDYFSRNPLDDSQQNF